MHRCICLLTTVLIPLATICDGKKKKREGERERERERSICVCVHSFSNELSEKHFFLRSMMVWVSDRRKAHQPIPGFVRLLHGLVSVTQYGGMQGKRVSNSVRH